MRQVGALVTNLDPSGDLQGIEGCGDQFRKVADSLKDTISFKGLSFRKAYGEGRLVIGIAHGRFRALGNSQEVTLVSVWRNDCQVVPNLSDLTGLVVNKRRSDLHLADGRDQSRMFVRSVEEMQTVEVSAPSFEGLYFIEDNADDLIAWRRSKRFMSVDGSFRRLSFLAEREVALRDWPAPVCADQFAPCVIQAGPEVVDSITENCLGMAGKVGNASLPRITLILSDQSARVCANEASKIIVKVTDVMFGPFDL